MTFKELNLFNGYGKQVTNEFSHDEFIIQVGTESEPEIWCDITISDYEFEIEPTGEFTDEQFSFLEERCSEAIQERKDHKAF